MTRVALVLHGWPPTKLGGTGMYVHALGTALQGLGHHVRVLAPRPTPGVESVEDRQLAGTLAGGARPIRWRETWAPRQIERTLRRWLETEKPDVVHIHHLSGLGFALPALARAAGCRVVITLHDYSFVCARGQLMDARLQPCSGPSARRCPPCAAGTSPAGIGGAIRARLRRHAPDHRTLAAIGALEAAHVLLAPSRDLARRMGLLGAPPIAQCPLPLVRPIPVAPAASPGPLRFLFASSVLPTKGPHRLLRAFAALRPGTATLTIAGPTPPFPGRPGFGARLRDEVRRTPGAQWLGTVAGHDIPELLAAHDVLVLPSTWPENSPLIVREATAAGLRVLVGACGGARELAPDAPTIPVDLDDAGLATMLQVEVARGRGRAAVATWQTAQEHARWLVDGPYRAPRSDLTE